MSWPPENGSLLPNADRAHGVREKLAGYSLKLDHVGRGKKAEGFARVLAITAADLEYLAEALLGGIRTTPMSGVRLAGEPSLPSSYETASAVGLLSLRARTDVLSCRSSHQRWMPGQSLMPPVEERREP